jgi:2-succinyl-6-hydroxy-2,4-cyclohexadiene-1-carboxylate synthase
VGYSQGGRVALAVAIERPELISHLILVSTAPGIGGEHERAERRRADRAQAAALVADGLEAFLEEWLSHPMVVGLERRGAAWRAADRAGRLANTADGLAAALVGMGQGAQAYFGERLQELQVPVLVIAGQLDEKYVSLAKAMGHSLPHPSVRIVPGAGHSVIGEQPQAVADLITAFLTDFGLGDS